MITNSENNSTNDKEAEIAANQFVKMLRQQAIYERVAKINAANKLSKSNLSGENESEEESNSLSLVEESRPRVTYFKWAIAASVIMGLFIFSLGKNESPISDISIISSTFRGANSIQSRSLINGQELRSDYEDIDVLIDAGKLTEVSEELNRLIEAKKLKRTAPVSYLQGVIAYQRQDFTAAVVAFRQTIDSLDKEYIENAYWNLLLSYCELKDMEAAMIVAKEMADNPNITKKQKKDAFKLLEAIK